MAKGTSGRGSAHGTPSSLTSLLALSQPAIVALTDPVILNQLNHGRYYDDPAGDRRRYDPTKHARPPHAANRFATRLYWHMGDLSRGSNTPVRFRVPNLVSICLRRKARREVLHALNRVGKGRGGRRVRNFWSDVKC